MADISQDLEIRNEFLQSPFAGAPGGYSKVSHGHSIKENRLNTSAAYPAPKALYFLYISIQNNRLVVKIFEDSYVGSDLEGSEQNLMAKAKSADPGNASNFNGLKWREPCYFTMVLDAPDWKFHNGNNDKFNHDPFIFVSHKNIILAKGTASGGQDTCEDKFYDPNYSFYDAVVDDMNYNGTLIPRVRCINFFKCDQNGTEIGHKQYKDYCFEIFLEAPYGSGGGSVTMLIDPDGQNQGPD
jgi:hypothetical protein